MNFTSSLSPSRDFIQTPSTTFGSRLAIQRGSATASEFQASPIEPTWILDGNPVARSLNLAKAGDDNLSCGLWDCTAGTFLWTFGCDEIVHILEGEVIVQDAGAEYTLRPGDIAFFPKGLTSHWSVPRYVKKFAIHRSFDLNLLGRLRVKLKKIWQLVRPKWRVETSAAQLNPAR